MTGTICYATQSGLGIQAKSFIEHGIIDKIFVYPHSTYKTEDWYGKERVNRIEDLYECDKLMFFETPFNWKVIPEARSRGIKTILLAMYECTQYPFPYYPDVLVGGSEIEVEHYKKLACGIPCHYINVPVEMKWKLRERAEVFIHNAGHGGLGGRNGTKELLEAMKYVKSPIKLKVRSQNLNLKSDDPRVEIFRGDMPYEDLWKDGDILIFPEKFGGSFLPMQEAYASGIPVMASDRFPTNTWLPKELLIDTDGFVKERIGAEFDCAILNPKKIAQKIDEWYGKDITKYSLMGKEWAKNNSWEALKPKYLSL